MLDPLLRNRQGAIAPLFAVGIAALVGFSALGMETGRWYQSHQSMQAAADSAAVSAAYALENGAPAAAWKAEATAVIGQYALAGGSGTATTTVNSPPTSGAYAGNAAAVEVSLSRNEPLLLSKALLGAANPAIGARAVALITGGGSGQFCVLVLSPTAADAARVNGNGNITLANCGLAVNSNSNSALSLVGNAQVNAQTVQIVGNDSKSGNAQISVTPATGGAPVPDPYANRTVAAPAGCDYSNMSFSGQGSVRIQPGVYCGGLQVSGHTNITLDPGVYYMDSGSFSVTGQATVSGTGVTLVLTNHCGTTSATVSIAGGATINLTAPTSGPTAGMAIYQDPNDTSPASDSFTGGSTQNITGVIYLPNHDVKYAGGSSTGSSCTHLVAQTLTVTGNGYLGNSCANTGVTTGGTGSVALVE